MIPSTPRIQEFPGAGSAGPFTFNFKVFSKDGIIVKRYTPAGIPTTLTRVESSPGADQYTVTLTANGVSGGAVTLGAALAVTYNLTIEGSTPITQPTPFTNQGAFDGERHEASFDRITMITREVSENIDRSIKISALDTDIDTVLPAITANKVLVTNADADGFDLVSFASLDTSLDTTLTGLASNDFLVFNGSNWVNKTPAQVVTILNITTTLPTINAGDERKTIVVNDAENGFVLRRYMGKKGSAIASATTTEIGDADSDFVSITGTTTITSFGGDDSSVLRDHVWLQFDGALLLTHNATSLILPTGANITTVAGDVAEMVRVSGSNWKCLNYIRASGAPLAIANSTITNAKLSNMAANTVKANNTSGSAAPSDVALSASNLLGRGSTGDVAAITLGSGLTMTGTVLDAAGSSISAASQSDQETATSTVTYVSPGRQQYHPSAAKAWGKTNTSNALVSSYNLTSVTDLGTGAITWTIATDFSSADWCCIPGVVNESVGDGSATDDQTTISVSSGTPQAAGTVTTRARTILTGSGVTTAADKGQYMVGFGDQA